MRYVVEWYNPETSNWIIFHIHDDKQKAIRDCYMFARDGIYIVKLVIRDNGKVVDELIFPSLPT